MSKVFNRARIKKTKMISLMCICVSLVVGFFLWAAYRDGFPDGYVSEFHQLQNKFLVALGVATSLFLVVHLVSLVRAIEWKDRLFEAFIGAYILIILGCYLYLEFLYGIVDHGQGG